MAETIETTETTEAPTLPISPIVDNLTDRPSYSPPSGQLTSTDILGKMEAGQPLYQGETLPEVPKGVSAKGFYGQFPGGASVYSQAPFRRGTYMPMSAPSTSIFDPTGGSGTTTTPQEEAPVDTQMDELVPSTDTEDTYQDDNIDVNMDLSIPSPTFDVDLKDPVGNIDLPDNLKELYENVTNYEYAEELNEFLSTGVERIKKSVDQGTEVFYKELKDFGDELGRIGKNPLGEIYSHIEGEVKGFLDWISDPFSAEGIDKAGTAIAKTVAQNALGALFTKLGFGVAAGPAAFLAILALSGEGGASQIGMPGVTYDNDSYDPLNPIQTTIAGYNSLGIGVNAKGEPVHVHTPGSEKTGPPWGYLLSGLSKLGIDPTKEQIEQSGKAFVAERVEQSKAREEDMSLGTTKDTRPETVDLDGDTPDRPPDRPPDTPVQPPTSITPDDPVEPMGGSGDEGAGGMGGDSGAEDQGFGDDESGMDHAEHGD